MRKWPAVLVMVIGALMLAGGVAGAINSAVSMFSISGSPTSTPGQLRVDLQPGTWVVYQTVVATTARPTLDQQDITVTGPGGEVATRCISCGGSTETLTLGNTVYSGVLSFPADTAGVYTVDVTAKATEVVVGPSLGGLIGKLIGWIGLILGGVAVGTVGFIWLIVAAVKGKPNRSRHDGPVYQPSAPGVASGVQQPDSSIGYVAGGGAQGSWYPDPENPGRLRWWDGRQWTDQTMDRPN